MMIDTAHLILYYKSLTPDRCVFKYYQNWSGKTAEFCRPPKSLDWL